MIDAIAKPRAIAEYLSKSVEICLNFSVISSSSISDQIDEVIADTTARIDRRVFVKYLRKIAPPIDTPRNPIRSESTNG